VPVIGLLSSGALESDAARLDGLGLGLRHGTAQSKCLTNAGSWERLRARASCAGLS
jgi:hypothetical protein